MPYLIDLETEYMLNLADYALGNGKWRVMGGYEIKFKLKL
jgi:hypothetical protein